MHVHFQKGMAKARKKTGKGWLQKKAKGEKPTKRGKGRGIGDRVGLAVGDAIGDAVGLRIGESKRKREQGHGKEVDRVTTFGNDLRNVFRIFPTSLRWHTNTTKLLTKPITLTEKCGASRISIPTGGLLEMAQKRGRRLEILRPDINSSEEKWNGLVASR